MTKGKVDLSEGGEQAAREKKLAVLWAALKTLPDEYTLHVALPDAAPVTRRFIGNDLRRCIEVYEEQIAKHRHTYDPKTLARLRAKEAGGG